MDFVEGFWRVHSKSVVLTVVNRFSPTSSPSGICTRQPRWSAFLAEIVRLHGLPCSIVSDHDATFTRTFWQELFCLSDVRLNMSTAFHP
jgi:hypothetical protein